MDTPTSFDAIERLAKTLPLEPGKVSEVLQTRLEHEPKRDTPVLTMYLQPADVTDSPYESVELRIPDPVFGTGGGLLNVTLKSDGGINEAAIHDRYGWDFQGGIPSPRYPPETPATLAYQQPWGVLTFGVT